MMKHVRPFLTIVVICSASWMLQAQPTQVTQVPENSTNFVTVDKLVYFTSGNALWRTDGTANGTFLLRSGFTTTPSNFRRFKGMAIFLTGPNDLWRSDGTPGGTIQISNSGMSNIGLIGSTNNYFFFAADETATGRELYRSDGTSAGIVQDVNPGNASGFIGFGTVVGSEVFFAGTDGSHGTEPFKTDGTSTGTTLIKDINPGLADGFGTNANTFAQNGLFFFRGNTSEGGMEPWVSDGTEAGTRTLGETVAGGENAGTIRYAASVDDVVYFLVFAAGDPHQSGAAELWKSGGTMATTSKIATVGAPDFNNEYSRFLVFNHKLYFFDRTNYFDSNLWVSDGTATGTHTVTGFVTIDGDVSYFDEVNDHLIFTGSAEARPTPFYRSNGNGKEEFYRLGSAGFYNGDRYVAMPELTTVGEHAYFADHDGIRDEDGGYPNSEDDYFHLYQTDGFTTQSMRTIFGINTIGTDNITNFNGKVLFTTRNDQSGAIDQSKYIWMFDPDQPVQPQPRLTLVNADTDKDIQRLTSETHFRNQGEIPINIRFDPVSPAGSVVFKLNDVTTRTETAPPYSFAGDVNGDYAPWSGAGPGTYKITAIPYSEPAGKGTAGEAVTVTLTIECEYEDDCLYVGGILYENWEDIEGTSVDSIPVDTKPTGGVGIHPIFEGRSNEGTNFGTRFRGYVIPPSSGAYTFWIASDDNSELWLSTDDQPANKRLIASVTGTTASREWDKYPSQKSSAVTLTAGKIYYIEALHKQGSGEQNVAVGWQLPDGDFERPIQGHRLSPFEPDIPARPSGRITQPANDATFTAPADIKIVIEATASEGQTVEKVEFFGGTAAENFRKLGEDSTAPYEIVVEDVPAGRWQFNGIVWDSYGNQSGVRSVYVTVSEGSGCNASGTILHEYWDNVSGNTVSSIPTNTPPTRTSQLTLFEGPTNADTNFGARIRGYICPPATGNYIFWIASNDHSELWLSTDDNPNNRRRIAYVTGATNPRQWDKFTTQKSTAITLTAGKRYYIEALHKQGVGSQNIAVGWQLPNGTLERPIPGKRLSPGNPMENLNPAVQIESPVMGQTFSSPATITIQANASDQDGEIAFVDFFEKLKDGDLVHLGQDGTAPYSVTWSDVQPGEYVIYVEATDSDGGLGSDQVTIEVTGQCTASGIITRDYWANVSGSRVADIPVNSTPTSSGEISIFEGPSNIGSNYATRIRGYICPPATGNYTFWISSNDHSELWLSTDDDPANRRRIAYITGATGIREWTKFATQQSAPITLTQGKRYYIEALHKQGVGSDNIAVGWRLPSGNLERPIPGSRLSPFGMDAARMDSADDTNASNENALFSQISIYPNPAQSSERELTIAGYEGIDEMIEIQVEIINLTGDVIFSDRISCGGDCSSYLMKVNEQLVPGIYLVNLNTNGVRFSKRLLVK